MDSQTRYRLVMTLAQAGIPVDTVSDTIPAVVTYRNDGANIPAPQRVVATQAQISAGNAILAAFDYSPSLNAGFEDAQSPNKAALRQQAQTALDNINTFLAVADAATAVQVRTAVKGLAQVVKQLILRVGELN